MIAVVLVGCGDTLPQQDVDSSIVTIEPLPVHEPKPFVFEGLPKDEREALNAEVKSLTNAKYETESFDVSKVNLGMSKREFELVLYDMRYEESILQANIDVTVLNTDGFCGEDSKSQFLNYFKSEMTNGKLFRHIVSASFGEVLIDKKCLLGLREIPVQKIYEKKT